MAFAYLDQLIQAPESERESRVMMSLSLLSSTREDVINAGTQAIVVDDAFELFEALIRNVALPDAEGRLLTEKRLLEIFQAKNSETSYSEDGERTRESLYTASLIEEPGVASIPPNVVFYLRLATVGLPHVCLDPGLINCPQRAQLKINSETYDGFLYDPETGEPLDAENFCNRFVDPVGVEAGMVSYPVSVSSVNSLNNSVTM